MDCRTGDARTKRKQPRRSAYKVRSKVVTAALTPSNFEFIDGAARRFGVLPGRMIGDVLEALIDSGNFDDLLERKFR